MSAFLTANHVSSFQDDEHSMTSDSNPFREGNRTLHGCDGVSQYRGYQAHPHNRLLRLTETSASPNHHSAMCVCNGPAGSSFWHGLFRLSPSPFLSPWMLHPAIGIGPSIQIYLQSAELWEQCCKAGTEMITAKAGRYTFAM